MRCLRKCSSADEPYQFRTDRAVGSLEDNEVFYSWKPFIPAESITILKARRFLGGLDLDSYQLVYC